jgi:uncharacterized membrane protein
MQRVKLLIHVLTWVGSIVYPFVWYFGQAQFGMRYIALFMALLWVMRAVLVRQTGQRALAVMLGFFFVVVAWQNHQVSMYWYPVLVSAVMLLLFGGSLFTSQSMVERFARLQHPDLPEAGVRYTRRVTQVWCGFFVMNMAVVLVLIQAQWWQAWMLYTGMISYMLMGTLFLLEWCYRRKVLK